MKTVNIFGKNLMFSTGNFFAYNKNAKMFLNGAIMYYYCPIIGWHFISLFGLRITVK